MIGFVYILTNEFFDSSVYKVGCTERSPHERANELSKSTAVPYPFRVLCYVEVENFQQVERNMHEWLECVRISANREFFSGSIDYAVRLLWWLPGRITFCEPPPPVGTPPLALEIFDNITHLSQTENPWAKSEVSASAESDVPFDVQVPRDIGFEELVDDDNPFVESSTPGLKVVGGTET